MAQTSCPLKFVMPITHTFAVAALLSGLVFPLAQPAHGSVALDCFLRQIEGQPSPATEASTHRPRTEVPRAIALFERPPILNRPPARQIDRVQRVVEERLAAFLRYQEYNSPGQNRENRDSAPFSDSDINRARALLNNPDRHTNTEFVRFLENFQNELVVRSRNPETYPAVEELLAFYQVASKAFQEHLAGALVDRTIRFRSSGYRGIDASGVTGRLTAQAVRGFDRMLDLARRLRSLPPAERAQLISRDPLFDGTERVRSEIFWGLDVIFQDPNNRSLNEGLRPIAFENRQQLFEYLLRLDRYLLQAQQQRPPGLIDRVRSRVDGFVSENSTVAESFANAMMAPEVNMNRELTRSVEALSEQLQNDASRLGDIRETVYRDFELYGITATVNRRLSALRNRVRRGVQGYHGRTLVALARNNNTTDQELSTAVSDRTGIQVPSESLGAVRAALRDSTNPSGYVDAILAAEARRLGLEARAWLSVFRVVPQAVAQVVGGGARLAVGVISAHLVPPSIGLAGLLLGVLSHSLTSANDDSAQTQDLERRRAENAEAYAIQSRIMTVERCYKFTVACFTVASQIRGAPELEARYPLWQRVCETGAWGANSNRSNPGHLSDVRNRSPILGPIARDDGAYGRLERSLDDIKEVGNNDMLAQACAQSVRYVPDNARTPNARVLLDAINSGVFEDLSSRGAGQVDHCVRPSTPILDAERLFCVWVPRTRADDRVANERVTRDYPGRFCGRNRSFSDVFNSRGVRPNNGYSETLGCSCCVVGAHEID